ncbi:MAG: hypothetical protein ACPG5P_08575, partial [Saprospiraceae bacterium]
MNRYFFFLFLALFFACQPKEKPVNVKEAPPKKIVPTSNVLVKIEQDSVEILQSPKLNASKMGIVRLGASLYYAGEMTSES